MSKLRVHIQNDGDIPPAFRIGERHVEEMLRTKPVMGGRVDVTFGDRNEDLGRGLADAEVLVAANAAIADLCDRAPRLAWVQSIFAGVENLVPSIPDGVILTNASGVHSAKAGEYALCALLMLNSRVPKFVELKQARRWQPVHTGSIAGKTVVVLGTGKIGAAVAERAKQMDMKVVGVSRSGRTRSPFDRVVGVERLMEVLPEADFVVNVLPCTPATSRLFAAEQFAALPPGAGFVNLGRGRTVDERALIAALRSKRLGGAVLDVFETQPIAAASPFWSLGNVIVSAYCAIDDEHDYLARAMRIFGDNLERYVEARPLENMVDLQRGY